MRPRPLDPVEIRILGCLMEKEATTPDVYPLTVKTLVAACNQRTNRDPVMQLDEGDVRTALDRLHAEVLVWPVSGARVDRYRHALNRTLGLDDESRSVLTLLMLRGPQTPGELRARADRLHFFRDVHEVERALERLESGEEPLVRQLDRRPGQKEARWIHLLSGDEESTEDPDAVPAEAAIRRPAGGVLERRLDAIESRLRRIEDALGLSD